MLRRHGDGSHGSSACAKEYIVGQERTSSAPITVDRHGVQVGHGSELMQEVHTCGGGTASTITEEVHGQQ